MKSLSLDPPTYGGARQEIERLLWTPSDPREVMVLFENDRCRLLSLRESDWSTIWVTENAYSMLKLDYLEVFQHFGALLQSCRIPLLLETTSQCSVVLLSGSATFIRSQEVHIDGSIPAIGILERSQRKSARLLAGHWKTWNYWHSQLGGVTLARCGVVFQGVEPPKLQKFVSRTLGHVISGSIWPKPWRQTDSSKVYGEEDLLNPGQLTKPVKYPTYMSATGWGTRSLSDDELKDAFDFPLWSSWIPTIDTPVKVCLTLLEAFLGDLQPLPPSLVRMTSQTVVAPIEVRQDSWLPALNRRLPGLWADEAFIKDKAVASDHEKVKHLMWNQRITLLFPAFQPRYLEALWRLVLNWQCRRLYKEFRQYLLSPYGPHWQQEYDSLRTVTGCMPLEILLEPPRKRNKGGGLEKQCKNPLFKDVNAGRAALHHYLRSTWWEWKHGSALLFWRWSSH